MAAFNFSVTVTDAATLVLDAETIERDVLFQVVGNKTLYLGDSSAVTSANGLPVLKHSAPMHLTLPPGKTLYAICATGESDDLRIFAPRD